MLADSWKGRESQTTKNTRAIRNMNRGSLDGRTSSSKPVSTIYTQSQEPEAEPPPGLVHVGPTAPADDPIGRLWFDTDAGV